MYTYAILQTSKTTTDTFANGASVLTVSNTAHEANKNFEGCKVNP